MKKSIALAAVFSTVAALGISSISTSEASSTSKNSTKTEVTSTHGTAAPKGGSVEYWGYSGDTNKTWSSKPATFTGGNPLSANAIRQAYQKSSGKTSTFLSSENADSFECGISVGNVFYISAKPGQAHGHLAALTSANCVGSFEGQWTSASFQRFSLWGFNNWPDYSGIRAGGYTPESHDDGYWLSLCNDGHHVGSKYKYRLYAYQTVFDDDSVPHVIKGEVSPNDKTFSCGSGMS